jgi:hypothetical protein
MKAEFSAARKLCDRNRQILDELGLAVLGAASAQIEGTVELLAGDYQEAEWILVRGLEELCGLGEALHAATIAALLARALLEQGRDSQVASILESDHETSAIEISSRVHFRSIRARFLARSGLESEAKLVGSEAVEMASRTESPDLQATVRSDLAHVLDDCGLHEDARILLREALVLYERKGNLVEATKARARLDH